VNYNKYEKIIFPSQYSTYFKEAEDKKNFKKLREFLWEREDLYYGLTSERGKLYSDDKWIEIYKQKIDELNSVISKKDDEQKILVDPGILNVNRYGSFDSIQQTKIQMSVGYIKEFLQKNIIPHYNQLMESASKANTLDSNIANVYDDIKMTQRQLDSTLAPEYKQQEFRVTISICFSMLIGVLLVVFFVIVYKRSDNTLSKELLSGNGLQFVTLFVLIIAVILFGILSILGSSELAAILSGISGYILGKGTQKDSATTVINNPPVSPP
jgi:hypothetical protein